MRKFTKEISALLASVAVGAATCAGTASASSEQIEPIEPVEGEIAVSDETIENIPTAGVPMLPDEMTEPTTEEEFPPMDGETLPPDEWIEPTTEEEIPPLAGDVLPLDGDVDLNGLFGVSDIIMFQKWLLAVPDTHLYYWQAADFNHDNKLNIYDLLLMKKTLIERKN